MNRVVRMIHKKSKKFLKENTKIGQMWGIGVTRTWASGSKSFFNLSVDFCSGLRIIPIPHFFFSSIHSIKHMYYEIFAKYIKRIQDEIPTLKRFNCCTYLKG